jgi:ribonuclease P protein component
LKKTQSNQLRQSVKIKKASDILLLFKNGNQWECPALRVFYLKNSMKRSRLGIVVSKQNGTAVKRNRIKRTIREFFRKTKKLAPLHLDILIKLSPKNETVHSKQLEDALQKWYDSIKR